MLRGCSAVGMTKHDAQPILESMIRERDGSVVDGNTPADYPMLARCKSCKRQIRIQAAIGSGWKHTAAPRPPREDETAKLTEVAEMYDDMVQRLQKRTPQASGHKPPTSSDSL